MRSRTILTLCLLATTLLLPRASADAACSGTSHPGGEWTSYGHDVANTRHQDDERTIDPAAAARLAPAWTFSAVGAGGDGDFTGTPIVAGGCMFIGSNTGWVFAANADDGTLVWKRKLEAPSSGSFSGGIPSSLLVADGRVVVHVNLAGSPYVAALNAANGRPLWQRTVATDPGTTLYASPVAYKGVVFTGISAASLKGASGSVAFTDLATGADLGKTYMIPQPLWEQGYGGGGVWSTMAVDTATGFGYVGTGDPSGEEHAHTNAIVKLDVDRDSPAFGRIVGAYKNNIYEQVPGFERVDRHFDFGSSPNLIEGPDGRTLVGDLQRAGAYHAVDARTMEGVWTTVVAPTQLLGNASSSSFDGSRVHVSVNPGLLYGLDAASGSPSWMSATADAVRYQPVATANGVLYTVDTLGFLDAFDTATGAPVLRRPLGVGAATGTDATVTLGGLSVARNTVYAAVGAGGLAPGVTGYVIAFRPARLP